MKTPRWTIAFLRALERTGVARWAAEDAGVDHTTAYARRAAHPEFAAEWTAALERFGAAADSGRAEEMAGEVKRLREKKASPPPCGRSRSAANAGDEIVNGKLRRVGPGRWSKAKERAFLEELAGHGSVRRACRAIGLSKQAVSRRRLKDGHLDAACEAAIEIGRRWLNGYLVEASAQTFDPDELSVGDDALPKVTIAEAIQIAKLGNGRAATAAAPAGPEPYVVADVAKRLEAQLDAIRAASLREGWQLDAERDCLVPPGWVQCGGAEP